MWRGRCAAAAVLAAQACAAAWAPSIVDQVGGRVAAGDSHRIVTLAPDVTEIVFAVGAGERVVAVAPACDFPVEAAARPRVTPSDPESIIAARPDLVIASTAGNDPRVVARLRSAGVRVATLDVTSYDRLAAACRLVGALVGASAAADQLASQIDTRRRAVRERAARLPRRGALYVAWWDPLIVAAPGTVHDELLVLAGLSNLAPVGPGRYPRVDRELLLLPKLEVVVSPDDRDSRALFARLIRSPAGLRLAGDEGRVVFLPADPVSRPGPRLAEALETLLAVREREP